MHWFGGGSMGLMWLFWLAVVAVVVFLVVRLAGSSRGSSDSMSESPETALKRRYARGEISREEYERILEDLRR